MNNRRPSTKRKQSKTEGLPIWSVTMSDGAKLQACGNREDIIREFNENAGLEDPSSPETSMHIKVVSVSPVYHLKSGKNPSIRKCV